MENNMLRNASWLPPSKVRESTAFEDQTVEPGRKQCFRRPNGRAGKRGMEKYSHLHDTYLFNTFVRIY